MFIIAIRELFPLLLCVFCMSEGRPQRDYFDDSEFLNSDSIKNGCSSDLDCYPGSVCMGAECIVIHCNKTINCPPDFTCQLMDFNRRCVPASPAWDSNGTECSHHENCSASMCSERGFCKTAYNGGCQHDFDCNHIHLMCVKGKANIGTSTDSGLAGGFCACTNANEHRCGLPCNSKNMACPGHCDICFNGMCTFSPGIKSCNSEAEVKNQQPREICSKSPTELCNSGPGLQCCNNCDCIDRCEGSFCSIEGMCIGPIPSIMQCTPEPGFDFEVAEAGLCREAATDCPPRHCCKYSRCFPFGCCDDGLCLSANNYANGTTPNPYLGKIDCHRGRREAEIQVANFIDSQDRNHCACTCNGTDPWALVAGEVEDTICGQLVDANVEVTYGEPDGGCLCSCTPVVKFSWTEWAEWTSCSVTCGLDGKQTRTRDCLGDDWSTSNQCGTDDTTELDIRGCDPVPENCIIDVDGAWSEWGEWSQCLKTCGASEEGQRLRTKTCDHPAPEGNGQPCPGLAEEVGQCPNFAGTCITTTSPVSTGWSTWSEWSTCSVTCTDDNIDPADFGLYQQRTRARSCDNPLLCPGPSTESEICPGLLAQCPQIIGQWTTWTEWTLCETSNCGSSSAPNSQVRTRECAAKLRLTTNKIICPDGTNKETKIDGDWSTWNEWSSCSATCGSQDQDVRSRSRDCTNPSPSTNGETCPGSGSETGSCPGFASPCPPVIGSWSEWSEWSTCTTSACGPQFSPNTQLRKRECKRPNNVPTSAEVDCPEGADEETKTDGQWSAWPQWSACQATCGDLQNNVRDRTRICDNPPPTANGEKCPGPKEETGECPDFIEHCPALPGQWTEWSPWAFCSAETCGFGANENTKVRERKCQNELFPEKDASCDGQATETKMDGNWSAWSEWSTCQITCGNLTANRRTRKRDCSNPPPSHTGLPCDGLSTEDSACPNFEPTCPPVSGILGPWSEWASCLFFDCGAPSDNSTQIRNRTCLAPHNEDVKAKCNGPLQETKVDGSWSDWSPWSMESSSGARKRQRTCSNPNPTENGQNCDGPATEILDPMSQWSDWSNCDIFNTCGSDASGSTKTRTRRCLYESIQSVPSVMVTCNETTTEIKTDGGLSEWSEWADSSMTSGAKERTRTCSNPSPSQNGQNCTGSLKQIIGAVSDWTPWNQCSLETCGPGSDDTQYRGRKCLPDNPVPKETTELICNATLLEIKVDGGWSEWSEWSTQQDSRVKSRQRTCDQPQPTQNGNICEGPSMEVIGTMGEWTLWSTCTFEACGTDFDPNKQLRKRTCVPQSLGNLGSVNIICNDTDIEIKIDGNWSEWSAWNTSNPTNVTRERLCNNPKPSENGNKCNGSSTQVLGSMTDWTEWSDCQETTCGLGFNNQTKSRTRNCSAEQYGSGIEVVCNSSTLETKTDGGWSEWSEWVLSKITGEMQRDRFCSNPKQTENGIDCKGPTTQVFAPMGEWSEWSACTFQTCGDAPPEHSKARTRRCLNETSTPQSSIEKICNETLTETKIDGGWSEWSDWTYSNVTNTKQRQRTCSNPTPSENGEYCKGSSVDPVPGEEEVMAQWSDWGAWSLCSKTCSLESDLGGLEKDANALGGRVPFRVRKRECISESIRKACPGDGAEVEPCPCSQPRSGWTVWSPWSRCLSTCQPRSSPYQMRRRHCLIYQGGCGRGYATEVRKCFNLLTPPCLLSTPKPEMPSTTTTSGVWSLWSSWSTCSVTCKSKTNESGNRERSRICLQDTCEGEAKQNIACSNDVPCRCCGSCNVIQFKPDACTVCQFPEIAAEAGKFSLSHVHYDRCIYTNGLVEVFNTNSEDRNAFVIAKNKNPILLAPVNEVGKTCPIGVKDLSWYDVKNQNKKVGEAAFICADLGEVKMATASKKSSYHTIHSLGSQEARSSPVGFVYKGGTSHFFAGECCRVIEVTHDHCVECHLGSEVFGLYVLLKKQHDYSYVKRNSRMRLYRSLKGTWTLNGGDLGDLENGLSSGNPSASCPHDPQDGGWWYKDPASGMLRRSRTLRIICHY